jgi:predicted transposase/invertase (TIGR01784 family)
VYYTAKLITEQIGDGGKYRNINKVISIIITDEPLISESQKYHHRFTLTDIDTGVQLSDLIEIHTLELEKLPETEDGTKLYDWAKFIDAETEEELDMLAQRNPEFRQPVVKLRALSADEKARDLYDRRKKAELDRAMLVDNEKKVIAKNFLGLGLPIEQIAKGTGLSIEQIEAL